MNTQLTTTDLVLGDGPADHNPALVYLAGLPSAHSKRTYASALNTVAGVLTGQQEEYRGGLVYRYNGTIINWGAIRFQHVGLIRSKLAEIYAPTTANKMLAALRGALKAAWRLDLISEADYRKAIDFDPVAGETVPAGRDISPSEMSALIGVCSNDETPAGARDGAIIALLYSCGLRRAELAGLDFADFDYETGTLTVRGKGRKVRLIPVVNGAYDWLFDWLEVRGDKPGPLFLSVRRGGARSQLGRAIDYTSDLRHAEKASRASRRQ